MIKCLHDREPYFFQVHAALEIYVSIHRERHICKWRFFIRKEAKERGKTHTLRWPDVRTLLCSSADETFICVYHRIRVQFAAGLARCTRQEQLYKHKLDAAKISRPTQQRIFTRGDGSDFFFSCGMNAFLSKQTWCMVVSGLLPKNTTALTSKIYSLHQIWGTEIGTHMANLRFPTIVQRRRIDLRRLVERYHGRRRK